MSDSRPILELPYGAGLDRATGVAIVESSKFRDLRNVILKDGKAQVRKGNLEIGRVVVSAHFDKVWQVDVSAGPAFVDQTANANGAGNNDWIIFPAVEGVGDYVAIGCASKFPEVLFDNLEGTRGTVGTVVWEYWNGVAWTALAGVTDGTVGFTQVVSDNQSLTFTVPSNWATLVLNGSAALYWIRARLTGLYTINPKYDQGLTRQFADDVVGVHAVRQLQQGVAFGYLGSNRNVGVNGLTGVGAYRTYISDWFNADVASGPPRIISADTFAKVFAAQDDAVYARRAMTIYVENDQVFGLGPLNPDGSANPDVDADLDGDGIQDQIKFRGVVEHLKYIFGWGFGTATDPDRPEIVRVCEPGEPLHWIGDHYFLAGSGGVPVITCSPCGDGLAVLKEYERYHIHGYDASTFGITLAEPFLGVAGAMLAITVGGVLFYWSFQGPRMATGKAPSIDLSIPLDLNAPDPSDLVAMGDIEGGFAVYVPDERCVLFVFGQRVYCLSIFNPNNMRWSYWELAAPAFCGAVLYFGGQTGTGTAPTAYMSAAAAVAGP